MRMDSHLALKVLHDVQENIVDIRPQMELDLDGIGVAKCIRDIVSWRSMLPFRLSDGG
jgi:hypothetical protein